MIYVVSLTSSFRPILYPPFACSSPGVISEVSLLVAMPQRVHQRQYFRIQNSRTDSRSIRSRFFITVCTKRTTFSANPVSLHTWTSRGDTWRATAYGNALSSEAILQCKKPEQIPDPFGAASSLQFVLKGRLFRPILRSPTHAPPGVICSLRN